MKQIKRLFKEYQMVILFSIGIGILIHFPLFIKNILTADVLLNTNYYSGYAWELSLGRFGLYFLGLLKGFIVVPWIDIFLGILILVASNILIFDLLDIKNNLVRIVTSSLIMVSPVISATLLFHYCSFSYLLAFFSPILAFYLVEKSKHMIYKYIVPVFLICLSLSIYQAYIAVFLTLLLLYSMIEILKENFQVRKFFISCGIVVLGFVFYYLLMKLSLLIFNISLDTYRGANSFGIQTVFKIPCRILSSYQSFYQFYFTDYIVTNTNVFMQIFNSIFFIFLIVVSIFYFIKRKIRWKFWLLFCLFFLSLPIAINVVSILLPDTSMQLLMSSGYLLLFFLLAFFVQDIPIFRMLFIILSVLMIRGYIVQDSATYQTLSLTYEKTYHLAENIQRQAHKLDWNKPVMISGSLDKNKWYQQQGLDYQRVSSLTYGFVSNYSLFWNEYNNIKNGWVRFMEFYIGSPIVFVEEDEYIKILNSTTYKNMNTYPAKDSIQIIDDVIVVKLSN